MPVRTPGFNSVGVSCSAFTVGEVQNIIPKPVRMEFRQGSFLQAVPAGGVFPLPRGEEGGKRSKPLLPTGQQILRCQRVGEFLKTGEVAASEDCIRGFSKLIPSSASRFANQWC